MAQLPRNVNHRLDHAGSRGVGDAVDTRPQRTSGNPPALGGPKETGGAPVAMRIGASFPRSGVAARRPASTGPKPGSRAMRAVSSASGTGSTRSVGKPTRRLGINREAGRTWCSGRTRTLPTRWPSRGSSTPCARASAWRHHGPTVARILQGDRVVAELLDASPLPNVQSAVASSPGVRPVPGAIRRRAPSGRCHDPP